MSIKQVIHGATLFMCFAILTNAHEEKCKNSDGLKKCDCIKSTLQGHRIFIECNDATTDDIQRDFYNLKDNGGTFYEVHIANSDLTGFGEIPEHMHPEVLKIVDVVNLSQDKIQEIISQINGLKQLTIDGIHMTKITRQFLGDKHNMEILSLNGNGIQEIDEDTFEHFHSLKMLSLEKNELKSIPLAALKTPSSNMVLKLEGNPISAVSESELAHIKGKSAEVFLNSIDCDCDNRETPFMEWIKETKPVTISCATTEKLKDVTVNDFLEGKFCNDCAGPVFLSSFLLIMGLYLSLL